MSFIEPTRTNMFFRPSDIVFGRIMEELDSYEASGLIDKGSFYSFVKEILHNLGAAVYREDDGILDIVNNNAKLPVNFCIFWAAYAVRPPANYLRAKGFDPRCDITLFTTLEGNPFTDSLTTAVNRNWRYEIECPSQFDLSSKVAVRYYIAGHDVQEFNFYKPQLLRFGNTPNTAYVDQTSPCYRSGSPETMSIDDNKFFWTSFSTGNVYIQYWGMPVDRVSGLPLIPDNSNIEKAIELYIEYRLLRKWYLNNKVSDLERRVGFLKVESDEAFQTAMSETKTPSFYQMMRMARLNKRKYSIFQLNTIR